MLRLPFRRTPPASRGLLPPELRWDAAPAGLALLLSRRDFLRALAVVLAALSAPLVRVERAAAKARGRFFTRRERETLEALVERILPADAAGPGARDLGAAKYIETLLTAFDRNPARLFAGGPFSGRTPYPDPKTGAPSRKRPKNAWKHFIAPTRLQDAFWRAELFGSQGVPAVAALDAQFGGPKKGLRDVYRESLAKADQAAQTAKGGTFASLSAADQDAVFAMLDDGAFEPDVRRGGQTFIDLLIRHTLEGSFGAPEYGGNRKAQGWALLGLEGDSQPLGYSIFSDATQGYVERADHPMSTANPDEVGPGGAVVAKPLTADGQSIQSTIVNSTVGFADGSLC